MLKVWGRRTSFNVQKVMWLIGELGLEHQRIDAGGAFGGLDDPDFLAMNPHGRIPVIDDRGTIVWESHAIIRYLAAHYAHGSLWPKDPAVRSHADRWMDWMLATLQPDFMDLFWSFYRTPDDQRDWSRIQAATARCAQHYRLLDAQLALHSYLAGNHLTMADLAVGASLYRYVTLEIERPAIPYVDAWYGRLVKRPAYHQHVMVPFDELRGRLDY
jgi:glutathione S-transferase